jgi:hypothetical protein
MTLSTYVRTAAGVVALALLTACGGSDSPSSPATDPTPQATPVPTPTPPQPLQQRGLSCGLSFGDPTGSCGKSNPDFLPQWERAVDMTYAKYPQAFDFNEANGNGQYKLVSPGLYLKGMLESLEAQNLCADFPEGSEEIQIKNTQGYHEQWDPQAGGFVRRGVSAYRATCTPAGFPLPEPPRFSVPGCSLGPSRTFWCQREQSSRHIGAVLAVQQEVFRARPDVFDMNDHQRGTDWPKVLDVATYHAEMLARLKARGYCVVVDEELGIKDNNDSSETFDILTAGLYARGGDGSYRATCVPADF